MSFSFHPEAEEELIKAINYYEEIEPGPGYYFSLLESGVINIRKFSGYEVALRC